MGNQTILEMKDIDMRFHGVHALDSVSLTLRRGEVHALMGENGAGKSTLMKILIGLYTPNKGEIFLNGKKVSFKSVKDSQESGISMIFQEFNQIKQLTIMENIYLGREPRKKSGAVDFKKMRKDAAQMLKKLGLELDPEMKVRELTVAKQQLVEIAKAVSYSADIIIMDEPTSALSENEIQYLLNMVEQLKLQGKAIVFISHKMREVYGVCDHVTILRDGKFIYTGEVEGLPEREMIKMMVDREVNELFPKQAAVIGEVVLEVKGLTAKGCFEDVSFTLRRGEILGVAGLMGAGRTELVEAIVGGRRVDSGEIYLHGQKIVNNLPQDAKRNGIVMVPEDRKKHGLVLRLSVHDNILMSNLDKCMGKFGLNPKKEQQFCDEYAEKLEIKMHSDRQVCANLSGGNQQKVVIARVLNADPDIIILDEPTRGIDVKTKSEIHRLMSQFVSEGKAVIMVSSELPEILGMSDRVVILHEGAVTGILNRDEANPDLIMQYAVGYKATKEI